MPYSIDAPPEKIKDMPKHCQEIFIAAFNAAIVEYKGDEAKANAVAYAAVKKQYRQDNGKWVKAARKPNRNFTDVEIARTGTFKAQTGEVTFVAKDFDNAEQAYRELEGKHKAVITLGHDEDQKLLQEDGYPNAGFVVNIRREDDRLMADLVDVPSVIADLVEAGRYNSRSIFAIRHVTIADKEWPFVVFGVSLLGADPPAVDSLENIAKVYASQGIELPANAIVIMTGIQDIKAEQGGVEDVETLINDLQQLLEKTEGIIYHRGGAPKFRTLVKAAVQELRSISKAKKEALEMESTKLIEVLGLAEDATEETILAALTELRAKAEAVKAKADDDGDAITTLRSDLAEAQKRIVSLENERASEKARKDVDDAIKARKFAPASRDTLIKMAVGNPVEFGELVKATPENAILAKTGEVGSDGDGEEMELTELELQVGTKMGLSKEELLASKKLEVK